MLILNSGLGLITVSVDGDATVVKYILSGLLMTLEVFVLFLVLGLTVKIGLSYDKDKYLPMGSYMDMIR